MLINPYELPGVKDEALRNERQFSYLTTRLDRFIKNKDPENDYMLLSEEEYRYIKPLQQDLRDALWVSYIGRYNPDRDPPVYILRIKPRRPTSIGRFFDSLVGWE